VLGEGESLELRWSEDKVAGLKIECNRGSFSEQVASKSNGFEDLLKGELGVAVV